MPKGSRENIRFGIGIIVILLLLFAYYFYTWRNAYNFRAAMDTCTKSFCDFADYYYPMGETILQTKLPIEGFVYSPLIAILLAVFPPFGFDVSLVLWGVLQAAFVILYLFIFHRLVPARQSIQLLFVALALSSFPILHDLKWGQVGIIYTVSILGMLVFLERDYRAFAAALLAFAASFKFFPLIFILPFIFRRDFRFLLHALVAYVVFLIAIPCFFLGVDGTWNFYSALLDQYRHFDWVMTSYNSQFYPHVMLRLAEMTGVDHTLFRLTASANLDPDVPLQILREISYSFAALNAGLVFLIQRARLPKANLWSVHIIFLTVPFILPTSWPVDLVYLPFGQALLAWKLFEGFNAPSWKRPLHARIAATLLLVTSIVISNVIFFNIIGDRVAYGSVGSLFWADLLLLVVSYMELLPAMALRDGARLNGSLSSMTSDFGRTR